MSNEYAKHINSEDIPDLNNLEKLSESMLRASTKPYNDLNGLLVTYKDDQLNECIKLALKHKTRVRYKCMDTFSNFLAFGTSGGAIYLFKLKSITHSSCSLMSIIPCDQGSIEVIKFLPNQQADNLLIAIGTKRGSLVIFKLNQLINRTIDEQDNYYQPQEQQHHQQQQQQPICIEIYRDVGFTNNNAIKLIEYDRDLLDSSYSFSKLYICDSTNRLYVLDSIAFKQTLRLFYSKQLPSLIYSVDDSEINQINVHRSQLLISTNETTRLFNEETHVLYMIGSQKRRQGFYGACFFNPNFKPLRILPIGGLSNNNHNQQQNIQHQTNQSGSTTVYSSTASINDLQNLLIFVARPSFRLWQVNYERKVKLTHQFESLIKNSSYAGQMVELNNEPLEKIDEKLNIGAENSDEIIDKFTVDISNSNKNNTNSLPSSSSTTKVYKQVQSDHFQKLIPIYSSTLGNLLLSYTQHELYVVDPIGARLIVWHSFESSIIIQICCNENELFIWTKIESNDFKVERLVLLAPTQFILELHRLHRYWTMILFVQLFSQLFRHRMALPLDGGSIITTEGGLLRNVLLNAWDVYETNYLSYEQNSQQVNSTNCKEFKRIIDEIIEESRQLKQSLDNLSDSRFFLAMTSENIDRLCSEPYASLVSLEVSIADLHSNHVIHFSKNALNRHKSVANLSRNLTNSNRLYQHSNNAKSNYDLTNAGKKINSQLASIDGQEVSNMIAKSESNNKVIVERLKPSKKSMNNKNTKELQIDCKDPASSMRANIKVEDKKDSNNVRIKDYKNNQPFFSTREIKELRKFNEFDQDDIQHDSSIILNNNINEETNQRITKFESEIEKRRKEGRCEHCQWPYKRIHLKHLDSIQQIQLKWIETNLIENFKENLEQIEEISFKHGLWLMFLKCLAFKNELDNYVICCLSLNDIRLLNIEQLTKTSCTPEELLDKILILLTNLLDTQTKWRMVNEQQHKDEQTHHNQQIKSVCFKCNKKIVNDLDNNHRRLGEQIFINDNQENVITSKEDNNEYSFNLANLFNHFTIKREANIKQIVRHLLRYQQLLNNCDLNSSFYLKAIDTYCKSITLK